LQGPPAPWGAIIELGFVEAEDLVDVALAAHDDGAAVVNVLGGHLEDAAELALEHARVGETASLLRDEGHGVALVEDAELALCGLGVGGVVEDAAVEDGAVDVGNHGPDVPGGVRLRRRRLEVWVAAWILSSQSE